MQNYCICNKYAIYILEKSEYLGIMLNKFVKALPFGLLSLAVYLFTGVGIHLIHPAVHNHLDHHQPPAGHCNETFPAIPDEDNDQDCPICEFQLPTYLVDGDLPYIQATDPSIHYNLPSALHLTINDDRSSSEPRAPPNAHLGASCVNPLVATMG